MFSFVFVCLFVCLCVCVCVCVCVKHWIANFPGPSNLHALISYKLTHRWLQTYTERCRAFLALVGPRILREINLRARPPEAFVGWSNHSDIKDRFFFKSRSNPLQIVLLVNGLDCTEPKRFAVTIAAAGGLLESAGSFFFSSGNIKNTLSGKIGSVYEK